MSTGYQIVLALHIITVVLMAAPYYNLVVVSERGRFGPAHLDVDRFFEQIVKGILFRCYFVQWTALILGVYLVLIPPTLTPGAMLDNWRLVVKIAAWALIMAIHNYVYFLIQPKIKTILDASGDGPLAGLELGRVAALRSQRKLGAASCLFLVMLSVIMGLQVLSTYPWGATAGLSAAAFALAAVVHRTGGRFGWV